MNLVKGFNKGKIFKISTTIRSTILMDNNKLLNTRLEILNMAR